jgi:hypothetical protein
VRKGNRLAGIQVLSTNRACGAILVLAVLVESPTYSRKCLKRQLLELLLYSRRAKDEI